MVLSSRSLTFAVRHATVLAVAVLKDNKISVRLTDDEVAQIARLARRNYRTVSGEVRYAIDKHLIEENLRAARAEEAAAG